MEIWNKQVLKNFIENQHLVRSDLFFFKISVKKIWNLYLNDAIFAAAIGNRGGEQRE